MGITPAETMAFGDYDNDITMLQCAEFSYAPGECLRRVKLQARHTAPANTKNGVVRVLGETLHPPKISERAFYLDFNGN